MDVCFNVYRRGVFIVSEGWFPDLATMFAWKIMVRRPPHGRPAMNFGQPDLVKLVYHCCLLANVVAKFRLIWHQSGAAPPPSGPTWLGLGPTWPSWSIDTHGGTCFDKLPLHVP
jgi:hypothetical protein